MKYFLKVYKILFLFTLVFGVSSCEWLNENVKVDRTVLIYMAANNNLKGNAISNLSELKKGYIPDYFKLGGTGEVLFVYYHIKGEPPRLLRVSKDKNGVVREDVIREYDKGQNSADVETLKGVLEYTYSLFPSEDNGLFLWSHGTGWTPRGFYASPIISSIGKDGLVRQNRLPKIVDPAAHLVKSFGDDYNEGGKEMEIWDLAAALPIKYSFIAFDACLMAGIEVVYELKDKADYIIASSAEVLADGFPYDKIMTHIFENEESNLTKVCEEFVNYYSALPGLTKQSATISLVETSGLEELASASAVIFNKDIKNIKTLDMSKVQGYYRYGRDWFYDLNDYMKSISSDPNDYNRFSAAMENAVIYKKSTPHFFFDGTDYIQSGFPITHFSGLSTYIPQSKYLYLSNKYKTLSWNIDSQMIK